MPMISVGENQFYYESIGNGEPLFLISGLAGDHNDWNLQLPSHSRYFTCYTFDNRGIGKSAKAIDGQTANTYTAELLANDVAGIMDSLGIKKAHILGGSMGGIIAQAFALNFPDKTISLSLHSTFSRMTGKMYAQFQSKLNLLEKMAVADVQMSLAPLIWSERTLTARKYIIENFRRERINNPIFVSKEVYSLQINLLLSTNYLSQLSNIKAPVLVTTGKDDGLIPPQESHLIHNAIPHSKLCIFPNCGHAVTVENPRGFNLVSLRFLKAQIGRNL